MKFPVIRRVNDCIDNQIISKCYVNGVLNNWEECTVLKKVTI